MSAPFFTVPDPPDRVGDGPGGDGRQARRPPSQRTSSTESRDYMRELHNGLVAAGHANVPPVEDHPTYGQVMVLPPYEGHPERVIRCEELAGELCWRWKDAESPPHRPDPIAPVTNLAEAVSTIGVILKNRAGLSGKRPNP